MFRSYQIDIRRLVVLTDAMLRSRSLMLLMLLIMVIIFQFRIHSSMFRQNIYTFSPPLTTISSDSSMVRGVFIWNNTRPIVHVVLTRFMQFQPDLLYLGNARLELFEMFCLPTIVKQTNSNFLWIIRVDPELRIELKNRLLGLVKGIPNVLVVGSNARIDDGHFRHPKSIEDITFNTTHRLWYGNLELLQSYHDAAQSRVVLETGLDADDGLALNYIDRLQAHTHQVLVTQTSLGNREWWKLWCVRSATAWLYYGNAIRLDVTIKREKPSHVCITPGLSRATTPIYRYYNESKYKKKKGENFTMLQSQGHNYFVDHFQIHRNVLLLSNFTSVGGYSFMPYDESDAFNKGGGVYTIQALRARTPTSTGMKDIKKSKDALADASSSSSSSLPRDNVMPLEDKEQIKNRILWYRVEETFGVNRSDIRACRDRIEAYLPEMLEDSIKGHCRSSGHSCKTSHRDDLIQLRNSSLAKY